MKLENRFSIPVPVADAWRVLLDLERIAPCVPGATLTSQEGEDYHGKIKVKLGPIGLTYNGVITIASQDEQARIAVLEGRGREARGNGTATATISCRLAESGDRTDVFVETDLAITGKPAQFGRGTLAEVAGTLIGQFATNLAEEISSSTTSDTPPPPPAGAPQPNGDSAEPIDLLDAAGVGAFARMAPPAVAMLLITIFLFLRRRRRAEANTRRTIR